MASLLATADEGYSFAGWTINGVEVSGGTEIDMEMIGPTTATASFTLNQYDLTTHAGIGGRIDGGVTYNHGDTVIVTALPDTGYSFDYWTLDGAEILGTETLEIEMIRDRNVSATFTLNTYTIVTQADTGGSIEGNGTFDYGSSVSLVALPDEGYSFAGWAIDGNSVAVVRRSVCK